MSYAAMMVPNVKLRPRKLVHMRELRPSVFGQRRHRLQAMTLLSYIHVIVQSKNVVIYATGVSDKPTIFKQAIELCAVPTPAFTDRVTHLIAESHGGAKYKSTKGHRLPILSGVVMSLYGITDLKRQATITKILRSNEGQFMQNIERPIRVTHLLCSGDEITDNIHLAEKFNRKGEAPAVKKDTSSDRQLPSRRTTTTSATIFGNDTNNVAGFSRVPIPAAEPAMASITNGEPPTSPASVTKIFIGMTFRALGEAKAPNVQMAVEPLGGKMSNSEDEEVSFISESKLYREEKNPIMRG
ncbi:hypothetical protein CVT24_004202 [Panaeolus cyanescens]|uniref:BRCT domain-containing protein n=1 Tax=Panaeolus cyanescens TaxID=181874 RepID=A0A409WVV7_9AGAR|nr:hypothetical protein CVT24_004202 [Panaeolus cyanescens]